jgi:hypothetical protein
MYFATQIEIHIPIALSDADKNQIRSLHIWVTRDSHNKRAELRGTSVDRERVILRRLGEDLLQAR